MSSSPADEQEEGEEPGNRTRGIVPSCARGLYMYACVGIGLLGYVPGGGFWVCSSGYGFDTFRPCAGFPSPARWLAGDLATVIYVPLYSVFVWYQVRSTGGSWT